MPDNASIGQYLRVTVSYTDTDGFFRTATSATSLTVVENVNQPAAGLTVNHTTPLIPGVQISAGSPTDPDGFNEDAPGFTYVWSWTTDDPADPAAVWTDYPGETANIYIPVDPDDVGRWIRVTVTYTDLNGTVETPSAVTSVPVTAAIP